MKAFLVSAILLAGCQISVSAQSACEINDVHTNPDPKFVRPAASAGQPPYRTNHFDWKARFWPIGWTEFDTHFGEPLPPNVDYKYILSPFYTSVGAMEHIAKGVLSDFSPRDGWELVSIERASK